MNTAEIAPPLFEQMPFWVSLLFLLWPIAAVWPLFMKNWPVTRRWQIFSLLVIVGSVMLMSSRFSDAGFTGLLAPSLPILILIEEVFGSSLRYNHQLIFFMIGPMLYPLAPLLLVVWLAPRLQIKTLRIIRIIALLLFLVPFGLLAFI